MTILHNVIYQLERDLRELRYVQHGFDGFDNDTQATNLMARLRAAKQELETLIIGFEDYEPR